MSIDNITNFTVSRYNGLSEMLSKWNSLSENLKITETGAPIILPDIFLISKSGTGRTEFLKYLTQFLKIKGNLLDFYGDVSWFEFKLGYCSPNQDFSEIKRFMIDVNSAAGFRNEFRGIIFIDIDEWKKHYEEKYFLDFLEYLSDNSDHWMIVLSVTDGNTEEIKQMGIVISCFLRLETITIQPPSTEELLEYARSILTMYNIHLCYDAENVISETIKALCNNKHFDWYKTVKMLCQNIAYTCYSEGKCITTHLCTEDILMFADKSEYVETEKKKLAKIGFRGDNNE